MTCHTSLLKLAKTSPNEVMIVPNNITKRAPKRIKAGLRGENIPRVITYIPPTNIKSAVVALSFKMVDKYAFENTPNVYSK
jgi:hypothetical protein